MPQIVTANRLDDGRVVFLTASDDWTADINGSALAANEEQAAELLAAGARAEAACVVIAPYLIDAEAENGQIRAASIRESIRAHGPTVPYGPPT